MMNKWLIVLLCKVAGSDLNLRDNGWYMIGRQWARTAVITIEWVLVRQQGLVKDSRFQNSSSNSVAYLGQYNDNV